jgi:hypothetical protein
MVMMFVHYLHWKVTKVLKSYTITWFYKAFSNSKRSDVAYIYIYLLFVKLEGIMTPTLNFNGILASWFRFLVVSYLHNWVASLCVYSFVSDY